MKIFKDIFTGDEMFSDASPFKEVDDFVYEVQGKFINKGGENYGIESDPSDGVDDTVERVINVVEAHKLVKAEGVDKKFFLGYIKKYMKQLADHLKQNNPGRVDAFQVAASNYVKKLVAKFDEYEFYLGETMSYEAGIAIVKWSEDGLTPIFHFIKDGLREEKY